MTTDSVPMQDPQDNPSPVDAQADAAVKPKRTRRPKAVEAVAAEAAQPAVAEAAATAEGDAPVPAKRAPRRRKPVEADAVALADVVDGAVAAEAPASQVSEPVVAEPVVAKRAPRRKAAVAQADTPAVTSEDAGDAAQAAQQAVSVDAVLPASPEQGVAEGATDVRSEGAAEGEAPTEFRGARRAAMAQQQASEVFEELLSGDFDKAREEETEEEAAAEPSGPYKRVLRPEPDAPKLQKVLAQAGVGSRRDIEQMIEDGRIEVNDQVAHIGQRISHGDRVKVAGKPIKVRIAPPAARILAYHKPVGEVVTHDDPQGRPTVFRRLPRLQNGKWMSVGRLDLNTEGLLLFTNSGELANQLMHPRFGVEREYAVRVLGSLDEASRERLLTGVEIDGQSAAFVSISNGLGEGVNQWYRVVITEGRNREVRKLFDAVGLTVNRLIRVRYGAIVLPRGLRRGVWAELGESDVRAVKSLAGMDRQDAEQQGRGKGGKQRGQQGGQQGEGQRGAQGAQGGHGQQQGQRSQQGQRGQGQQGKLGRDGRDGRDGGREGGRDGRGGRGQQGGQFGQGNQGGQRGGQGQRGQGQQGREREQMPQGARDADDDFDNIGPIPNPLEQTFDRRFVKGSKRITSGFGRPDQDQGRDAGGKHKGPKQPDPMQTSVGYIGADAYFGGGRSGGNRRGGGGGGRGRR